MDGHRVCKTSKANTYRNNIGVFDSAKPSSRDFFSTIKRYHTLGQSCTKTEEVRTRRTWHTGCWLSCDVLGRYNWPSSHGTHRWLEFQWSDEEIGQAHVSSSQNIQNVSQNCQSSCKSSAQHINVLQPITKKAPTLTVVVIIVVIYISRMYS